MFHQFKEPLRLVSTLTLTLLIVIGLNFFVTPTQATGQMTNENLEAIARATTVLIGQDLEREYFEEGDISDAVGSGVIIARTKHDGEIDIRSGESSLRGQILQYTYYVLTNQHVVADTEVLYGIRTSDGEFYSVNDTYEYHEQFPDFPNIYRFGEDTLSDVEGIDLAVVKFTSDKLYPVASVSPPLAASTEENITEEEPILISGWPVPSATGIQERLRLSQYGQILQINPDDDSNGGFGLNLTPFAASNMSGGPVFDTQGRVIGIYGRGGGSDVSGYGFAVPINHFLRLQNDPEYRSKNFPMVTAGTALDPQAITFGKTNITKADNISPEEYATYFGARDVLNGDPSYQAMQSLAETYGCLTAFEDGTYRPALFETRGELIVDTYNCIETITQAVAAQQINVEALASLQTLQETLMEELTLQRKRVDALEAGIADLRAAY